MRYILFGTGDCYERYKRWFQKHEIVALLDNSEEKQGKILDGHEIVPPSEGIKREFDAVVILSFYVNAMKTQLRTMGVEERKIYHFYDLHKLIDLQKNRKALMQYGDISFEGKRKKILLLNQNLAIGGPAFTLFDTARILKKNGYHVVYGSMIDGPLRELLLRENIPVIIDENLLIGTMQDSKWVAEYDLIICNAINFYVFLSDRDTSIPMIWWLHDSLFFYEGVDRKVISRISGTNLWVYTVGDVPKTALKAYAPGLETESLLYGVKEAKPLPCGEETDICFVTVGFVEARKGQDILMEAVKMLPYFIRKRCRFYFVGKDSSAMAGRLKKAAGDIPEIIFTGTVGDVNEYLSRADVLICPSREDPMPAVCAEAMMQGLPCIVSDVAGTAAYIKEKENGLIFQSENVEELAGQIIWCIDNKQKLTSMGKESRKIYEEKFSMDIFEKHLLDAVEQCFEQGNVREEVSRQDDL